MHLVDTTLGSGLVGAWDCTMILCGYTLRYGKLVSKMAARGQHRTVTKVTVFMIAFVRVCALVVCLLAYAVGILFV